ncbi:uncharacterized protein [Oryza sativa Japonica Group]|uniref:uncharacterized protein n=1 Tax=Oryza sativa subsp. japonica TaxID=39947 RepID=UPI00339CE7D4
MGPKRRRKGKTQVGAAARDEEPSVVVDADDADGGARSHVVAGEAAGGGGADGGSPASRAASPPPPTAAGGQGGLDIEEKGPAFGDARWRNKATGVDIDDSSRDDADGGLSKTVLSWTIQDILLDNEVQKVPTKFKGLQHYLDVHSNLLREEVRITIKSSLLKVETTQCFRDFVVSFAGPPSIYYIDIDLYGIDNCQHVVKDGDLFFLSSQPLRGQLSGCFGIATDVGCDNQFQRSFKICGIINSIIRRNEKCKKTCACAELCAFGIEDSSYLDKYNEEQQCAMTCIMSKAGCHHNHSVDLVWGPPGTGKTRLAAGLAICMLNLRLRILVCVPLKRDIHIFLKSLQENYPSFNIGKALVLNNLLDKDMCNIISETTLANRASELYVALFVWKAWVKEMAALLGLDMYCRKKCVHHDEDLTCNKCEPIEFSLMSFKKKFGNTAVELRKCSTCLIKSLSATSLSDLDVTNVNNLLIALSQFENLMQKSEISDYSVKRAFGITIAVDYDFEDCCTAKSLDQIRRTCLALTETVLSSIELPQLEGWSDLEDFCIRHSHIIISTPGCFARLQSLKMDQVDVLIVDKAAQIKENDLLVPLSIPPRHVVLLGDHQHLQPIVKTEGCKEAGCTRSLFQRLLHLSFTRHKLIKQYMMHPLIRQFPSEHFYKDKIVDGQSVESINLQFPAYTFFDVVDMEDFSCMGKKSMEAAVVLFLLQKLCEDTCTFQASLGALESLNKFQYACLDPPQDFQWNLSVDNLKSQYEHHESTEFGSEEKNKRGKHRLESALDILKVHGVIGSNEVNSEEALFRISAHNRVDAAEPENLRSIEDGNVMVGCFRLSYNYFYLKPGEVYWYDKSKPYVHSRSNLPAAHAVMVIGHGKRMMDRGEGTSNNVVRRHVVIQNSEGKRFGFDGTRRVLRRSLTHLYQMKI